jgi:hypothetical protein
MLVAVRRSRCCAPNSPPRDAATRPACKSRRSSLDISRTVPRRPLTCSDNADSLHLLGDVLWREQ